MNEQQIAELKERVGYSGKSQQWQYGFDLACRELQAQVEADKWISNNDPKKAYLVGTFEQYEEGFTPYFAFLDKALADEFLAEAIACYATKPAYSDTDEFWQLLTEWNKATNEKFGDMFLSNGELVVSEIKLKIGLAEPSNVIKTLWAVNIPEEPDSEELLFAATSKEHAQSIVSRLHNEIFETYPTLGEPIADSIYVTEWQDSAESHAESLAEKWWEHTSFLRAE